MNVWKPVSSNPEVTAIIVPLTAGMDDGECICDKAGSSGKGVWVRVEHCQLGSGGDFFFLLF